MGDREGSAGRPEPEGIWAPCAAVPGAAPQTETAYKTPLDVPVRRVRRAVLGFEMCSRPDSRPLGPGTLAHRPVDRNLSLDEGA